MCKTLTLLFVLSVALNARGSSSVAAPTEHPNSENPSTMILGKISSPISKIKAPKDRSYLLNSKKNTFTTKAHHIISSNFFRRTLAAGGSAVFTSNFLSKMGTVKCINPDTAALVVCATVAAGSQLLSKKSTRQKICGGAKTGFGGVIIFIIVGACGLV